MEVEDLFCGVGGFTCGALMEGAVVSSGVDNNDAALRAWSENVPASTSRLHEIKVGEALPYDDPTRHVHASPPCTELSRAKAYRTEDQADSGLSLLRWTIECLKSLTSWSIETVATSKTRQLFDEYAPYVAYKVIDAYDFGIPQTRVRLIAGPPALIREFSAGELVPTVTIREAYMHRFGQDPPASHVKNTSRGLNSKVYTRSVDGSSFTVTASHPLMWCDAHGSTLRCMNAEESAMMMGFPREWHFPKQQRLAQQAIGNAVPPPIARRIMRAAQTLQGRANENQSMDTSAAHASSWNGTTQIYERISTLERELTRRIARLESMINAQQDTLPLHK